MKQVSALSYDLAWGVNSGDMIYRWGSAASASVPSTSTASSAPSAQVTVTAEVTKAQAELARTLTNLNAALESLAKALNILPATSPSSSAQAQVRSALAVYQSAVAGKADATLGGSEMQSLYTQMESASKTLAAATADASAANVIASIAKAQEAQMAARNAKAALMRAKIDAVRTAAGTSGPVLVVSASTPTGVLIEADGGAADDTTTVKRVQGSSSLEAARLAAGVGNVAPVVVSAVSGATDLFYFASQTGSFDQLEIATDDCIYDSSTTKSNSLFSFDDSCDEPETKLTTYYRSVGTPLSVCPAGKVKSGALCYDACPAGYTLVAGVCWQQCPSGYPDAGATCGKPAPYGRGAGYPWKLGDTVGSLDEARARCRARNPQGCEKNGQIIYPKCRSGFNPAGSNICSPVCPSGMTDAGAFCAKKTETRAATPLVCPTGKVNEGGLYYEPCKTGYTGSATTCRPS